MKLSDLLSGEHLTPKIVCSLVMYAPLNVNSSDRLLPMFYGLLCLHTNT